MRFIQYIIMAFAALVIWLQITCIRYPLAGTREREEISIVLLLIIIVLLFMN